MKMNASESLKSFVSQFHPNPVDTDGMGHLVRGKCGRVLEHHRPRSSEGISIDRSSDMRNTESPTGSADQRVRGRPRASKAEFPSGNGRLPEANAGRRKARGIHNPPDRSNDQLERVLTGSMVCYPRERSKRT